MKEILNSENIENMDISENTENIDNSASSDPVDPRARMKATLSPEKYTLLENTSKKMKIPMPNDEQFFAQQDKQYPLQREYLKDGEGNFILTDEEDALLSKYNYSVEPNSSEHELNKLLIETKMFDNLPLEMKEEIAQTLKTIIDDAYCNPEDEKNKPQSTGLSKTDMVISGIISLVATPAAGILYGSAKSAYNEQNQCSSPIEVITNTALGGIKGAAYNAVPIVGGIAMGQIESVYSDSVSKMENERKNQRMKDIASGEETMSEKELLHIISTEVNSFQKVVSNERIEHDLKIKEIAHQKEMQEIENQYKTDMENLEHSQQPTEPSPTSFNTVSTQPVNNDPYVQPLGNLNLGYQNITLDKISALQADFENSQSQENTKRRTLSM